MHLDPSSIFVQKVLDVLETLELGKLNMGRFSGFEEYNSTSLE